MGLDVTKVVAAINQVIGAKRNGFLWEVMNDSGNEPLVQDCRTVFGIQENQYYIGTNAFISSAWQGYVKRDKQAKGDMTLAPSMILQRRHMLKVPIFPDDIRGTIEGKLAQEEQDMKVKDIVKYLMDGLKMRISDDRVSLVIYKGKYEVVADGNVWDAEKSVDGFNEKIEAGLETADDTQKINGWDIGALDDDTIYAQMNDAVKQTPAKFRTKPMLVYMSDSKFLAYKENRLSVVGGQFNPDDKSPMKLKDSNWTIRPSVAMESSDRVFATVAGNMVKIHDQKADLGNIKAFEKDIDELTLHANWCEAYGFDFNGLVWANRMSNNGSGGGDEDETFVA
jgi:hypothetical protein